MTNPEFINGVSNRLSTILSTRAEKAIEEYLGLSLGGVAEAYCNMNPLFGHNSEIRDDNLLFFVSFLFLSNIQYHKEGTYGRSWCKRGELDVFFNTARKFDRLENMMVNGAKDEVGEARIDTVGDLANYGILWMSYFLRENPEAFGAWVENNIG